MYDKRILPQKKERKRMDHAAAAANGTEMHVSMLRGDHERPDTVQSISVQSPL